MRSDIYVLAKPRILPMCECELSHSISCSISHSIPSSISYCIPFCIRFVRFLLGLSTRTSLVWIASPERFYNHDRRYGNGTIALAFLIAPTSPSIKLVVFPTCELVEAFLSTLLSVTFTVDRGLSVSNQKALSTDNSPLVGTRRSVILE